MTLKDEFELEVSHGINNGDKELYVNQKAAEYIKWLECKVIALRQPPVSFLVCPKCKSEELSRKPVTYDCYECGHTWQTGS